MWPSGTPRPSKAGHAQGQFWSDSPIRGVREPPDTRIHLPPPPPVQVRDLVQLLVLSTRAQRPRRSSSQQAHDDHRRSTPRASRYYLHRHLIVRRPSEVLDVPTPFEGDRRYSERIAHADTAHEQQVSRDHPGVARVGAAGPVARVLERDGARDSQRHEKPAIETDFGA